MKKLFFLLILLSFQAVGFAQFNIGVNAIGQITRSYYKNLSDLGYGGSASIGYTFAQRIDMSVAYSIYGYTGTGNFRKLNSKTAEVRYYFLKSNVRPYLGFETGIYTQIFEDPQIPRQSNNNFGIEPKVGILLNSGIVKNLNFDIGISRLHADLTDRGPNAINLSVGLKYYFVSKTGCL